MLNPTAGPLRPRVLVVDDELAKLDTALGRAAESLAAALDARNVDVVRALSYEDGHAIVASDASLRAVLLDWNLGLNSEGTHAQATVLLHKLRERNAAAPVFLLADRERTRGTITIEVAEMVDEFVWLLDDSADFIAGRVMAAIRRYEAQLLPSRSRIPARPSALPSPKT
jgi:arginine decarboxylase